MKVDYISNMKHDDIAIQFQCGTGMLGKWDKNFREESKKRSKHILHNGIRHPQ